MSTIAVATDFSTRSDRAIRRAELLAKRSGAQLALVHVIDDDQPERMIRAARQEADAILMDLSSALLELSGVTAEFRVCAGSVFGEIPAVAAEVGADLIVMGPHRPQVFRDAFRGSTIERTVQKSSLPILVANGLPAAEYRRALCAVTLDDPSAQAVRFTAGCGYFAGAELVLLHVYDALARPASAQSLSLAPEYEAGAVAEARDAHAALVQFAEGNAIAAEKHLATASSGRAGADILGVAAQETADLVVIGRSRKGLIEAAFTGRASADVLREADLDVLIVPS